MEGQGPLANYFDEVNEDSFFGEKTWEKAESFMQKAVLKRALQRAKLSPGEVDYILAGDLLNQCIGSAFGLRDFGIPYYGLYGACSTMGESISLAAMLIDGGNREDSSLIVSVRKRFELKKLDYLELIFTEINTECSYQEVVDALPSLTGYAVF